jgi:hypothetical protein
MTNDEAQAYTPGSELTTPDSSHLDAWELHLSFLDIAAETDRSFTEFLCWFKLFEKKYATGKKPSQIDHADMIKLFIHKEVNVQS